MKRVLCILLCFMLVFSGASAFGIVISEDTDDCPKIVHRLLEAYENGEYGDEVYYFYISRGWDGHSSVVITVNGTAATLVYTESSDERIHTRELTADEYQSLVSYMDENEVDSLPDWNTYSVIGGVGYSLTHISQAGTSFVGINNPGVYDYKTDDPRFADWYAHYVEIYGDDSAYVGLVELFLSFIENGDFELSHSSGASILVPREEYDVQAVWKDGDDFRVCIKTDGGLQWRSFKDRAVGEAVPEPEGMALVDVFSDIPNVSPFFPAFEYSFNDYNNTYPWQCGWNGYRVRCLFGQGKNDRGYGLWLTSDDQAPKKIISDKYANPIVIPGTDLAVCKRDVTGRDAIYDLVKVDLVTGEVTPLELEPARNTWPDESIKPVAMIGGKLLLYREQQYYLWDPSVDEICPADGDFAGLLDLTYRFLQKADGDDRYYSTEVSENGKTVVGILDTARFKFEPIAEYDGISLSPMEMWVDADNATVYAARNGDLLELPLPVMSPQGAAFTDIDGHWAQADIGKMAEAGYLNGYPDGTFRPDEPVTRAEFAKIICEVYDFSTSENGHILFRDINKGDWFAPYVPAYWTLVDWQLLKVGIIYGWPEQLGGDYVEYFDSFDPQRPMTRIEAAQALHCVTGIPDGSEEERCFELGSTAADSADFIANRGITVLVGEVMSKELMNGDGLGNFRPYDCITRAEVCALINRAVTDHGMSNINEFINILIRTLEY